MKISQGETKDVTITRMKSEQIADKRRMFEQFTTILDLVAGYDERQVMCVRARTRERVLSTFHFPLGAFEIR